MTACCSPLFLPWCRQIEYVAVPMMIKVTVKEGERTVSTNEDLTGHLNRGDVIKIEYQQSPPYKISIHPDDPFDSRLITLDTPFHRFVPGLEGPAEPPPPPKEEKKGDKEVKKSPAELAKEAQTAALEVRLGLGQGTG